MADPRDVLSSTGTLQVLRPFKHDNTIVYNKAVAGGSAQVGLAVTINADDTVSLVGDGERVAGKLIAVENGGVCVVQTHGPMTLPGGSGATLTVGGRIVGDLGASSAEGYIRLADNTVLAEAFTARGVIENNDVTTAVKVEL